MGRGALFFRRRGYDPRVHPHLTEYRNVAIPAWAATTAAGDAAASLAAVASGRRHLACDPAWGWQGRQHPAAALHDAARRVVLAAWGGQPAEHVAVGVGTSKGDIAGMLASHAAGSPVLPASWSPGSLSTAAATWIGCRLHLPCATAAACSTGLACLLAGADLVERGLARKALVGAAEASLTPLVLAGFANAGVLCGQREPQAFAEATGFAPAEGAAAFVLADAGPWRLRAGVRLADARHETRFEDPATLRTCLAALWDCCPHPDLIVCHATGTAAGDAYELAGLADGPWRDAPRLCCKPWIGHALGASSAVELALALELPLQRMWKLSLGFGGHLVAVAVERDR